MGWTYTMRRAEGSYKELFVRHVLYNEMETEKYKVEGIREFGASIQVLLYLKDSKKYAIDYFLVSKSNKDGYGFGYKGISWEDIPYKQMSKEWIKKLEQTEEVKAYCLGMEKAKREKVINYKSLVGKTIEFTVKRELHYKTNTFTVGQKLRGYYVEKQGLVFYHNMMAYRIQKTKIKNYVDIQ